MILQPAEVDLILKVVVNKEKKVENINKVHYHFPLNFLFKKKKTEFPCFLKSDNTHFGLYYIL